MKEGIVGHEVDKERNTLKKKEVRGADSVKRKSEFRNEKNSHFSLGVVGVLLREQLFNLFTKKLYTKRLLT